MLGIPPREPANLRGRMRDQGFWALIASLACVCLTIAAIALPRLALPFDAMVGVVTLIRQIVAGALVGHGVAFGLVYFAVYLAVLLCTALPVAAIVSAHTKERNRLGAREELLRLVMAHSPDAILGLDGAGVCRWADGPLQDYLGLAADALIGLPIDAIAAHAGMALIPFYQGSVQGQRAQRTIELRPPGQAHLTLEASLRIAPHHPGQRVSSVIALRDITQRKVRELAISRRIETDDLTGVFNRVGFRQRLERAIELAGDAGDRRLTLALIDVDYFKAINDTHGHAAGDVALVEIARRVLAGTRDSDVVGRLSGDEFAILLECGIETARPICDRIVRSVAKEPIAVSGNVVVLSSISCGLAELRPGMSHEVLFDGADLALYEAKRAGRNAVRSAA